MSDLPEDWIKTALTVTGHFEDSSDPLGAVTGDFDGMGISLGVLQWNIGSHSLQSMVNAVGRDEVVRLMPELGDQLWQACNSDVAAGLAICRSWEAGSQLKPEAFKELKSFTRSDAFVAQQVERSSTLAAEAWSSAVKYAALDPSYGQVTKALFCWFFDLYTQNGGPKSVTFSDVRSFIERNGVAAAVAVVCEWLASRPKGMTGYKDSNDNAVLWKSEMSDGARSLLIFSYLRSQLSRPEYKADVMNRKGTIAVQLGWVHREKHDLRALLQ
jgi:hypothetical protein